SLVAAGNTDRRVYLFDRSGRELFRYTTGSIVKDIAISADGTGLAATSDMVYYFDLSSPVSPETTPAGQPPVTTLPATTTPATASPTTPAPAPAAGTPPGTPPETEAMPEETSAPGAGSGSLAILALGIGAIWLLRKR
ncbi:MAG: hypothetical protein LUO97_06290, partial [Methanomicrobiales archaeon]|nr:hypothetical protein [Methanomicrobiales archaeon]